MAINVDIRIDLSPISQKAIENALASRIAQLQKEELERIEREALEKRVNRLEERRQDTIGIQDLPSWNPNPPRIELSSYVPTQKQWNMFWWRVENAPDQRRLRAYISNTSGSAFRELNLDWAYQAATIYPNGDPSNPEPSSDVPDVETYLDSFLPDWLTVNDMHRWDDMPPLTGIGNNSVLCGSSQNGFVQGRVIQRWFANPRIRGLTLSTTGPFVLAQRVLWERRNNYGGTRLAVLPLIDDIAVVVVFTETIIKTRFIDFFRIKKGGGTIPANTPRSFVVPSVYRYAQQFRYSESEIEEQPPTWEWLVCKVPPGFGQIRSVTARMAPRNPSGNADVESFDQTHSIKFVICKSSSMPSHYRKYYADIDYRTGSAKPRAVLTEDELDPANIEWAPVSEVGPVMTIGTDPQFFHPDAFDESGNLRPEVRGWNDGEVYNETVIDYPSGSEITVRTYRSYGKIWSIDPPTVPGPLYEQVEFADISRGDYLFVRILECGWDNQDGGQPYTTAQYGVNRYKPYPESEENENNLYPFDKRNGGYSSDTPKAVRAENLYITLQSVNGSTLNVSGGGNALAYIETAHVMEDTELITYHNDPLSVEPNVRSFVVSDSVVQEIETPSNVKKRIASKGVPFRVYTDEQKERPFFNPFLEQPVFDPIYFPLLEELPVPEEPAEIFEAETSTILSHSDSADRMFTGLHGPVPGKNLIDASEVTGMTQWIPSGIPPGYSSFVGEQEPDGIGTSEYAPDAGGPGNAIRVNLPSIPRSQVVLLDNWNSFLESRPQNIIDYREAQMLVGRRYIFSVFVKAELVESQGDGFYPSQVRECETSEDNVTGDPEKVLLSLQHVLYKSGRPFIREYTVQSVSPGGWNRIWFDFTCAGDDRFRIDNWNGKYISNMEVQIFGAQIEEASGTLAPTQYMPRNDFLSQIYWNAVLPDPIAKANETQVIGEETSAEWSYGYSYFELFNSGRGINFEILGPTAGLAEAQDFINTLNSNSQNFGWPEEEQRTSNFSPVVYDRADALAPITSEENGGASSFPLAGGREVFGQYDQPQTIPPISFSKPEEEQPCYYGGPVVDEGPVVNRTTGLFQEGALTPGQKYFALAGEPVTQARINASQVPDKNCLNNSFSKPRLTSSNCRKPDYEYGNLDPSASDYSVGGSGDNDNDINLDSEYLCLDQGFTSVNRAYPPGKLTIGTLPANKESELSAGIVNFLDRDYACSDGPGNFKDSGNAFFTSGKANPEDFLDTAEVSSECKYVMEKAKKLKGFLDNCKYPNSELLLRGDGRSLPQVVQFTSWGQLERNADSLRQMGYIPEEILAIGSGQSV